MTGPWLIFDTGFETRDRIPLNICPAMHAPIGKPSSSPMTAVNRCSDQVLSSPKSQPPSTRHWPGRQSVLETLPYRRLLAATLECGSVAAWRRGRTRAIETGHGSGRIVLTVRWRHA